MMDDAKICGRGRKRRISRRWQGFFVILAGGQANLLSARMEGLDCLLGHTADFLCAAVSRCACRFRALFCLRQAGAPKARANPFHGIIAVKGRGDGTSGSQIFTRRSEMKTQIVNIIKSLLLGGGGA